MGVKRRGMGIYVGYARPIALALSRPAFAAAALKLAVEAVRSFFLPQNENALFRRRRIVNVDHPLDSTIPLDPSRIGKYLDFVRLWMGSFYYLWKRCGSRSEAALTRYIDAIRELYSDAGSVYWKVHTTTTRPAKNYDLRFALIHATDPHQNCVPSLHVLIVVANWRLALATARELGAEEELGPWIESLRREAVAITESVLFVKQHSVNCIGASLYYLARRGPRLGDELVRSFVRELFAAAPGAPDPAFDAGALRARILEVYEELDASYAARADAAWREPILEFIEGYAQPSGRSVSSMAESISAVSSG
jgi:hypothetical protein